MSELIDKETSKKIIAWLLKGDTGVSSKTIVGAILNVKPKDADVPHDPSDFGRCYRLLNEIPELQKHLHLVSKKYPKWKAIIEKWDRLSDIYRRDLKSGVSNELYRLLKESRSEFKDVTSKTYKLNEKVLGADKIQDVNLGGQVNRAVHAFFSQNNHEKFPEVILLVKASLLIKDGEPTYVRFPKTVTLTDRAKYAIIGCSGRTEVALTDGGKVICNGVFDIGYQSRPPKAKTQNIAKC